MHKFNPENAMRLERAERYDRLPPVATLEMLGLRAGMTMVDIGAGTGFFARAAAAITGSGGTVYATDIEQGMLDIMLSHGGLPHLKPVLGTEYTVPLPDGIADLVLMAFVVHETPDIPRFMGEAARLLRPGGRIAVIEWIRQTEEHGPPETERLARETLLEAVAGGHTVRDEGTLNSSHYYIVLEPSGTR